MKERLLANPRERDTGPLGLQSHLGVYSKALGTMPKLSLVDAESVVAHLSSARATLNGTA